MILKRYWFFIFTLCQASSIYAGSMITESEGEACTSADQSKQQVEDLAIIMARRKAAEQIQTFVQSSSAVENFAVLSDVVKSYSNAQVRTLETLEKRWNKQCVSLRIRAEVLPVDLGQTQQDSMLNNPVAPLTVKLWTNQESFKPNDNMLFYVKANKPFFGRLVYTNVDGEILQILPNPIRLNDFFQGGVVYQIPNGKDQFELTVTPPLGTEKATLYASTAPLGKLEVEDVGSVYSVANTGDEVAQRTRGLRLTMRTAGSQTKKVTGNKKRSVAEFDEY